MSTFAWAALFATSVGPKAPTLRISRRNSTLASSARPAWMPSSNSSDNRPRGRLTSEKGSDVVARLRGAERDFRRDLKAKQFPMKLVDNPVVTKIVHYNGRITFTR